MTKQPLFDPLTPVWVHSEAGKQPGYYLGLTNRGMSHKVNSKRTSKASAAGWVIDDDERITKR